MLISHTPLHFFDMGTKNAHLYRDEVLEAYMRLFRGTVAPNFMFMNDNANSHWAHTFAYILQEEDIRCMNWFSRSPDLNHIEHVWLCIGRDTVLPLPRIRQKLKVVVLEEETFLPQKIIHTFIKSRDLVIKSIRAHSYKSHAFEE